jgi:hypothetical protein
VHLRVVFFRVENADGAEVRLVATGVGDLATFKHSTRLYTLAIVYNSRLDADGDGIVCEKA